MTSLPIRVAVPGKLYVAGEYAVVAPGQPAILIAVDRYMTVTATTAQPAPTPAPTEQLLAHEHGVAAAQNLDFGGDYALAAWLIMDKLRAERNLPQRPVDQHFSPTLRSEHGEKYGLGSSAAATIAVITASNRASDLRLSVPATIQLGILASIDIHRAARNPPQPPVDLHFSSTLRSEHGEKYGLGSSGAATIAVITAFNEVYDLRLSVVDKIKLGILASIEISPNASGGDLAAGALGGWVYYQAPDRDQLERVLTGTTCVTQAMTGPAWIPRRARRIPTPSAVQALLGWTARPAATDQLVTQATTNGNGLDWDVDFRRPSAANVNSLILALAEQKFGLIHSNIRTARKLLLRMAQATTTLVETPALATLIETAELFEGVSAKTSGAGGGDCGIVLAEPWVNAQNIYDTWRQHGIHPLEMAVTQLGARLEE